MYFAKQLFLLFLVNQEKLLVVLANAWKIFLNKFTFNTVTSQVFFQGFYLDFELLLLLHFRFPRARIFQNISFSNPFTVAGLGITRQLTRCEAVVLLILFAFLRLPESSKKNWGMMYLALYIWQSDSSSSVTFTTHPSINKELSSYISYFTNCWIWSD